MLTAADVEVFFDTTLDPATCVERPFASHPCEITTSCGRCATTAFHSGLTLSPHPYPLLDNTLGCVGASMQGEQSPCRVV